MRRTVTFTAKINGDHRRIFTADEKDNGDITFITKNSKYMPENFETPSTEQHLIKIQKYSIHRTRDSLSVNTIKFTTVLQSGREYRTYNVTKALKSYNNIAGIFLRRAGNLQDTRYDLKGNEREICNLGEFDADEFQPVVFACVSNANRPIICLDNNINAINLKFKHFNVGILWQFCSINSNSMTNNYTFKTFTPEQIAALPIEERFWAANMEIGFNDIEMLTAYEFVKKMMLVDALKIVDKSLGCDLQSEAFNKALRDFDLCFKSGTKNSPEYQAFGAKLIRRALEYRQQLMIADKVAKKT